MMAKYKGIFEILGSIGRLTFYRSKDGTIVRGKSEVNGKRIKTDPAFQGTRENSSEFGHVSKCGQLIRQSLGTPLHLSKDFRTHSRMTSVLHKVKNLDPISSRGERKVSIGLTTDAGKALLKGFDFNAEAPFDQVFLAPYSLDTSIGTFQVADFSVSKMTRSPKTLPEGKGFLFFYLFIQYFQEVNDKRYALEDPVLTLLEVGPHTP